MVKSKSGYGLDVYPEKTVLSKFTQKSSKVIKELNEDSVSISESSDEENEINENEIINENKKKEEKSAVENQEKYENSSSLSNDNPELLKEVDKIMNNNHIQKDYEKNHEKTNSSFKDDKSTKMEIDRITNMQSYSES